MAALSSSATVASVLPVVLELYPETEVEIVASDRMRDVFGGGFDAGIRYSGAVPEHMVVQRL